MVYFRFRSDVIVSKFKISSLISKTLKGKLLYLSKDEWFESPGTHILIKSVLKAALD